MAQLNQILWSNITWGFCGICFLCLFGLAIKFEWNSQLTPKAWNRPRNVLKNVLKQHRLLGCINFYPITWWLWASKLTYEKGMEGIPGTGTRDDGWTGPTLKMTLDGVILLKYHKMLSKIGLLATVLCCGVLLPVYTSSVCDPAVVGERECRRLASLTDFENLTISHVPEVRREDDENKKFLLNYDGTHNNNINNNNNINDDGFNTTTVAGMWGNDKEQVENENENEDEEDYEDEDEDYYQDEDEDTIASSEDQDEEMEDEQNSSDDETGTSWYLGSWFPPRQEAPSNYTPEPATSANGNGNDSGNSNSNSITHSNRNGNRNGNGNNKPQLIDEEGNIIIPPAPVAAVHTASSKWVPGISWRHMTTALCSVLIYIYTCYLLWHEWIDNLALRKEHFLESDHYPKRMQELDAIANLQTKPEDPVIAKRPPFVPHPEMREVPPSVGLYSVLYQLPKTLVTFDTDGATQVDRQLVATANYFHESVPARPGFTSSVVAATLIPDAARVARCWTVWYRLESKVRMVRYVRKIARGKQQGLHKHHHQVVYEHISQALKNSNHAMKMVAQRAYRRVSRTASEALQLQGGGGGVGGIAGVVVAVDGKPPDAANEDGMELTSLASSSAASRLEEQAPLVKNFPGDDSSCDGSDHHHHHHEGENHNSDDAENNEAEDDGGFWQNFFGGSPPKQSKRRPNPFKDKNSDDGNHSQNGFGMPADFEEGSFVGGGGDSVVGDIELQRSSSSLGQNNGNASFRDGSSKGGKFCGALTHGFKYENYDVKQYATTISHAEETELIDIVDGLGIEELSVFAREYSQSSSSPCPLGCFPNSLKFLELDELRELEEELWEAIKVLNEELLEARENVIRLDDDFEVEPTMISTTATDTPETNNNEDVVVVDLELGSGSGSNPKAPRESSFRSSRKNEDSSNNDEEILMDSPRSQRSFSGLCKLRNRGNHHQQWEKVPSNDDDDNNSVEHDNNNGNGNGNSNHGAAGAAAPSVPTLAKRMAIALPPTFRSKLPTLCCGGKYNPIFQETINNLPKYYGHVKGAGRAFVNALDHPAYAVVTFSSRQAAIEARQFLSDHDANKNNTNLWQQIDEIPIPPLADAPPRKPCFCRGCCRPVTLTINYKEKTCRRLSVYIFMLFFCCFYTIPLAFISLVLNPRWLGQFFPNSKSLHDPNNILYRALAGPASGLATTLFMALLPQIFKSIAFYEGTSSSLEMAERKALILMWYFMLVTAFFGQYLATMLIQWYYHAGVTHITQSLWSTVNTVATLIPSAIAPQWLNWIIIRYGFIWPGGYFFQMNTFLTKISGMTCINRVVRGGGAGGPTPFRIYVDSGIVLLCIVGLSPMVPIVAPIATIYFMVVQPMLRWLLIFVYRPRYDTGGERWPLCHQIIISSLIMAQILTSVTLALKGSLGGAILIGCCTFPTFMFGLWTEERFLRPYKDTAMLQTSRLDGGQDSYNESQREEFRRWLVDCHKASYVPTCLLGSKENLLTVEPAVVIPKVKREEEEVLTSNSTHSTGPKRRRKQKGGIYDRKYQ